jgi:hypothetical protein
MKCPLQQAFCFSNPLLVTCPPCALEIFCQCFKARYLINKQIKKKPPSKGTREEKKKGSKSKQKTTPQSAECTMGRKHVT